LEGEDVDIVQTADIDRRHRRPSGATPRPNDWMPQVSQKKCEILWVLN
jgi:hypothetical protein